MEKENLENGEEKINFAELLKGKPINLLPEAQHYTKEQLKGMFPENNIAV